MAAEPVPADFNYDRWLGPTPWRPYNEKRVKGDYGGGWRCFLEYGGRKNGDWGAHHFDIIQNALGMDDSGPVEFIPAGCEGCRYQTHVYANGLRVERYEDGLKPMIEFQGTKGRIGVSRDDLIESDPPDLFARRDAHWRDGDPRFHELNDALQYLGSFAFRDPVPAYKHTAAQFLALRGWIASSEPHPAAARRPDSDVEILRALLDRLDRLVGREG